MVGITTETDPLVQRTQQQRVLRANQRRTQRHNLRVGLAGLVVLVSCAGLVVYIRTGSLWPSMNPFAHTEIASVLDQARHAQTFVQIAPKTGVYSVNFDDPAFGVTPTTTFAALAALCVHSWYEASMMAVLDDPAWTSDAGIQPSNVKPIRRALLMTRDMLDVFGPVFPDTPSPGASSSSKHKNKKNDDKDRSLWRKLRLQYRQGYQLMGTLKDLEGLTYSQELLHERVQAVLDWKAQFLDFQKHYRIRHFLYTPYSAHNNNPGGGGSTSGGIDPTGSYAHKSSHLFWATTTELPLGTDRGTAALQSVAVEQLHHAQTYLQTIQNYTTIVPIVHEQQFHNLRKELRIFLDEYNLFGTMLVPPGPEDDATVPVTKVSTSDHLETVGGEESATDSASSPSSALQQELQVLNTAQKKLGHINDKWTAREIYVKDKTHASKQESLKSTMDTLWLEFLDWKDKHHLEDCIENVLQRMQ